MKCNLYIGNIFCTIIIKYRLLYNTLIKYIAGHIIMVRCRLISYKMTTILIMMILIMIIIYKYNYYNSL